MRFTHTFGRGYGRLRKRLYDYRVFIVVLCSAFASAVVTLLVHEPVIRYFTPPPPPPPSPPPLPGSIHYLYSPTILDMLEPVKAPKVADSGHPWSGVLATDEPFRVDTRYIYIKRGGDACVGFNHFSSSLRCRVLEAVRLNRTLVMDDYFCTAQVHATNMIGRIHPMYAYIDMDAVRR